VLNGGTYPNPRRRQFASVAEANRYLDEAGKDKHV
jgi:hypothetical protein